MLPVVLERNMGVQAMKPTANAKLLQNFSIHECLSYALSLPITCAALGCTTVGQIEDEVRVAKTFRQLTPDQMAAIRERARPIRGPILEDWKRNIENASLPATHHDV